MRAVQQEVRGWLAALIPEMFKRPPSERNAAMMLDEASKTGANAAALILFDQCLRDYREVVAAHAVPTLLTWGTDEKFMKAASSIWLEGNQRSAELVWFEDSGHCPMWEEPERFNAIAGDWIAKLPA